MVYRNHTKWPHFLASVPLHQKSQWLHGSRKSVCTCHLFTCNSGTLHRVISVSLSSLYLCGRVVLWSWPTRKQGDLGGQRGRKGKDKGNIANKQESDHETWGKQLILKGKETDSWTPESLPALTSYTSTMLTGGAEWERGSVWLHPGWYQWHRPSQVPWARCRETLGKLPCWGLG